MAKRNRFRTSDKSAASSALARRVPRHDRQPTDPVVDRPYPAGGTYWLHGRHAVTAAVANPHRRLIRVLHVAEAAAGLQQLLLSRQPALRPEPVDRAEIERLLPPGTVHQGLAALAQPLPETALGDLLDRLPADGDAAVVVLDQVTDPHNVGAILRSAAAFGAAGVVLTERHAAPEGGTLAKAASGALEHVPLIRVVNLARAIDELKQAGFWCAGLANDGPTTMAAADLSGRVALVLGAEGEGLRRLTRDRCDLLIRLPTTGPIGHLNVSNAAAVALYELARNRRDLPRGVSTD